MHAFLDYLQDIRRTQGVLRGTPYDTVEARLRLNGRCNFRLLVEHEAAATLLERSPECREFIEYPAPLSYMQQWADLDPAAEWKQVSSPVLVLHGEFDFISSAVDATYLRDMIESFHPGNATLATVPAMDHYLARVGSWSESLATAGGGSTTLQDALVDTISTWMKRQIR